MLERREYVRLGESLKIGYKIMEPPGSQGGSFSEDISGGGLRFPVKYRLDPGTILDLEIYLPKLEKPIVATAEVVWWRERSDANFPFVIGVKFAAIDAFDRGKILNYIRRIIQDKAAPEIQWIE